MRLQEERKIKKKQRMEEENIKMTNKGNKKGNKKKERP